jgi:hypothetical protein
LQPTWRIVTRTYWLQFFIELRNFKPNKNKRQAIPASLAARLWRHNYFETMKLYLKLKHWQLFMITFIIPLIIQIFFVGSVFLNGGFEKLFYLVPMFMTFFIIGYYGWIWTITKYLNEKLPENLKIQFAKFNRLLSFSILYSIAFSFWIPTFMNSTNPSLLFALIVPFHFFFLYCFIYALYFTAKTIKTIEFQRELTFSDFAGEFFLLMFFQIGFWFIQPRINKIFLANKK